MRQSRTAGSVGAGGGQPPSATRLCRKRGFLGFIVPSPLLSNLYARNLRRYVLEHCCIHDITNFGIDVFADPTIHTCVVVLERSDMTGHKVHVRKQVSAPHELAGPYDYAVSQRLLGGNENSTFDIFLDLPARRIVDRLASAGRPLGDMCFIRQCIKTGNDSMYVRSFKTAPGGAWVATLRGRSIGRYSTGERDLCLRYGPWLARNWKNRSFYETPKIGVRETGNRIVATIDRENRYFLSSLYSLYPKAADDPHALEYLLGVLNSTLATYFVKVVAFDLTKGAFTKIRTNQLGRFPIRPIDFSKPSDKTLHDLMVSLVRRMLDLNKKLPKAKTPHAKNLIDRDIAATDRRIDDLVYELYGLTEKEIGIVEGGEAK